MVARLARHTQTHYSPKTGSSSIHVLYRPSGRLCILQEPRKSPACLTPCTKGGKGMRDGMGWEEEGGPENATAHPPICLARPRELGQVFWNCLTLGPSWFLVMPAPFAPDHSSFPCSETQKPLRARSRLVGPPSPAFLHHRAFQWRARPFDVACAPSNTTLGRLHAHTHTHIHIVGKGTSYARDGRTARLLGQGERERENERTHSLSGVKLDTLPRHPPLLFKNQKAAPLNVPLTHVSFRSLEGRGGKNGGTHPTTARMRARPLRGDVGGGGTYVGDMPGARPWATDDAHAWAEPQGNAKTQPSRPADKHPIPIPPILTHSLTHSPRFALQKSIPPSLPLPLTLSSTSSIQGAARPSVAAAAAVAAKWALPFAGSPIQPVGPPLPFPSPPTGGREGRQGQRQKTETAQGPSRDVRPPAHRPPLEYRSTVVP
ncbi:hypothetical protein PCL_03881 [Purpureocillium lilacinum]|uniref:Uncharacterized protein n=1 Tax=Purpureocillium lilacinum TaxID=33203 RepID=A0A2U3EQA4_PURLI|nr:hypothetical protein PCL_03881 [Purpureocillium lilacinum]